MKTHCDHGHEMTPDNSIRFHPDKPPECRECYRLMGLAYNIQHRLGLPDRTKIGKQAKNLLKRQQELEQTRLRRRMEKCYAQGDTSRSVLPEGEGQGGEQRQGGADLPGVDGASAHDGEAPETQEKPLTRQQPSRLSAKSLATLAPQQPAPKNKADAAFLAALQERMTLYRQDGLDALRDLAMMPISTNSMQNQVKFLAASKLVGNLGENANQPATNVDSLLKQMNEEYRNASPKIREVRERVISFDSDTKVIN